MRYRLPEALFVDLVPNPPRIVEEILLVRFKWRPIDIFLVVSAIAGTQISWLARFVLPFEIESSVMAASMGKVQGGSWVQVGSLKEKPRARVVRTCVARLTELYRTLRVEPGASEKEVKRAFRQLALQYHPDVCKGNDCGIQFHRINEAYDTLMSSFREEEIDNRSCEFVCDDDHMRGMYDSSWDMWEEWMGWEGAGIRDYSSHVNPYI